MSGLASKKALPKTSAASAALVGNPTFEQICATLRFALRYANGGDNIFIRLFKLLESTDLITVASMLPVEELNRFMPLMQMHLTRIRMNTGDLIKLKTFCEEGRASSFPLICRCDLLPQKSMPSGGTKSEQLNLLGQLLPRLENLNLQATITDPFPDNLKYLNTLIVYQNVFQDMFDRICENCPLLQKLYTRNESKPDTHLDIVKIVKCEQLRILQLPLMLLTPVALGQLRNLKCLVLQRMQSCPDMDWLLIVRDIINAKRCELQTLKFNGTWLTKPLDLSVLQLNKCWTLRDVQVNNCRLADPTGPISEVLPFSCRRLCFMNCYLNTPIHYLGGSQLMTLLELHKCQMSNHCGQMLMQILRQRKQLPILNPLQLHFSLCIPLSSELIHFDKKKCFGEWLQVQELSQTEVSWKTTAATITMTFGERVNFTPDLDQLDKFFKITAADVLQDFMV